MDQGLNSKIVKTKNLDLKSVDRMFELLNSFYENVKIDDFREHLFLEDYVSLIYDNNLIVGFSTFSYETFEIEQKPIIAVYSGDTIILPQYWGKSLFFQNFLMFLWKLKLKTKTPVYWFLMSKGYKTYLLLSNNFNIYYPRPNKPIPKKYKELMDFYFKKYFNDYYDSKTGLINFKGKYSKLKETTAPVSSDLLKSNELVYFFEKSNPNWTDGVELGCVGEVTWTLPFKIFVKKFKKNVFMNKLLTLLKGRK